MALPKVIQVTVSGELAVLLTKAKAEQPLASWSRLVAHAAMIGLREDQTLVAGENLEEFEL